MVDPVSIGTIVAAGLASAGISAGVNALTNKKAPAPPPAPPPIAPAASPTKPRPGSVGTQQSFLSGVAASGLPGSAPASSGSSNNKTLLGQ